MVAVRLWSRRPGGRGFPPLSLRPTRRRRGRPGMLLIRVAGPRGWGGGQTGGGGGARRGGAAQAASGAAPDEAVRRLLLDHHGFVLDREAAAAVTGSSR